MSDNWEVDEIVIDTSTKGLYKVLEVLKNGYAAIEELKTGLKRNIVPKPVAKVFKSYSERPAIASETPQKKRCTCGSHKTYGASCQHHSNWCDLQR